MADGIAPDIMSGADLIPHTANSTRSSSPDPHPLRSRTMPPPQGGGGDSSDEMEYIVAEQVDTSEPDSPPSSSPVPVLRRSSSSVHTNGLARAPKHLRFTAVESSLRVNTSSPVYYPGSPEARRHKRGIPRDQQSYLSNEPGTPNLSETADQLRRTISLASLDSLLLISQDAEEREKFLVNVRTTSRRFVWRDEDEERVFPTDAERTIVLASKRAIRSFLLAFTIRAGVNSLLLLFRTLKSRRLKLAMIRNAIFGEEPLRFGAMIGTFTFLNTLTLHLLRLAPPFSYIRRRLRAGLFAPTTFGPPQREGDEGEHRWHAAVAGAVGSLGLLWETVGRRRGVAQQMFVRGLQASYNQYTPQAGIRIPHGDILLFGLCCGQIMYGFLLSPETIPRDYNAWIQNASGVPRFAILGNRTAVRHNLIAPTQVQRAIQSPGVTPKNMVKLKAMLEKINAGGWRPGYNLPCAMLHPWVDSCIVCNFNRFFRTFRFMLPVYSALHLIPMLVFRRHAIMKNPTGMLARALWGITRSCSFLGGFVVIYQVLFCMRSQTMDNLPIPKWFRALLSRKENFWLIGFATCASLFLEEKKRRAELAMYVLPKALEAAWASARKRAWVPVVPFGETILGAAAMAMVMDAYKHQPAAMSGLVRRLLYQLVGPL